MILDDCLSAVDAKTEQEILNNIREDLAGVTSVIISHRVSSVMQCDEILFLDHGQVVERGSHEALMAQKDGIIPCTWNRTRRQGRKEGWRHAEGHAIHSSRDYEPEVMKTPIGRRSPLCCGCWAIFDMW